MPWDSGDAHDKTKKANSPTKKRVWAQVANQTLARTGDEGRAVREANAVVQRIRGRGRASNNVVRHSR